MGPRKGAVGKEWRVQPERPHSLLGALLVRPHSLLGALSVFFALEGGACGIPRLMIWAGGYNLCVPCPQIVLTLRHRTLPSLPKST